MGRSIVVRDSYRMVVMALFVICSRPSASRNGHCPRHTQRRPSGILAPVELARSCRRDPVRRSSVGLPSAQVAGGDDGPTLDAGSGNRVAFLLLLLLLVRLAGRVGRHQAAELVADEVTCGPLAPRPAPRGPLARPGLGGGPGPRPPRPGLPR